MMTTQISTDNHIQGSAELTLQLESVVESVLGRFGERITRVEVHLSDENSSQKTHGDAMRCRMEARPAGRQPVIVTADAATMDQAIEQAAQKMEKLLDSTFDRLDDPRR
jgi:ribosome-associated translation inhibitor RaiA